VNTYQLVLATDESATYAAFLYRDIQWGDEDVITGFNAGDGLRSFMLHMPPRELVSSSNVGTPGAFIFRVDQESIQLPMSE